MYGIFEITGNARKVRVGDKSFQSLQDGIAHFGDKVVDVEIDGDAADLFVNIGAGGSVFSVESI